MLPKMIETAIVSLGGKLEETRRRGDNGPYVLNHGLSLQRDENGFYLSYKNWAYHSNSNQEELHTDLVTGKETHCPGDPVRINTARFNFADMNAALTAYREVRGMLRDQKREVDLDNVSTWQSLAKKWAPSVQ